MNNSSGGSSNSIGRNVSIYDVPKPKALSKAIFTIVGVACKIWVSMNRVETSGVDRLINEIDKTYELRRPMITISNHIANLDDPLIWGAILPSRIFMDPARQRWTLGASNILFTNWFYSKFFTLGKCIKIVRGDGIYQDGMNESIDRLSEGQWLHIFPEGKVSQQTQLLYFKWGLGRLVGECYRRTGMIPLVIPVYHQGMEKAMPLGEIPIPKIGCDLNIKVGDNIYCDNTISKYLHDNNIKDLNEYLSIPSSSLNNKNKNNVDSNSIYNFEKEKKEKDEEELDRKRKDFYKAITLHIEEQYQLMIPEINRGRFSNPSPPKQKN